MVLMETIAQKSVAPKTKEYLKKMKIRNVVPQINIVRKLENYGAMVTVLNTNVIVVPKKKSSVKKLMNVFQLILNAAH